MTLTGTRLPVILQARGGCVFELLARFNVANQGYANAQVLGVPEGVDVGSLTVVETDGALAVVGNLCQASGKVADGNAALGAYSTNIVSRVLGKGLLEKTEVSAVLKETLLTWGDTASVEDPNLSDHAISLRGNDLRVRGESIGGFLTVGTGAINTEFDLAIVLGGYNTVEEPWDSLLGADANYRYGASAFIKGDVYTDWTLIWKWPYHAGNSDNLYPNFQFPNKTVVITVDDFRVPVNDYSPVLQPSHKDTFTDANGTALAAHTPDVGGAITVQNGAYDIQANKANVTVSPAAPEAVFTVSGLADQFGRITANTAANGAGSYLYRYTDNNNFWYADVDDTANRFAIIERNGGVDNVRANAALAIAPATDYEITVITEGTGHQGVLDGGNRLTFVSAVGQAATLIGSRCRGVGTTLDNFHFQPRSGYAQLDVCP